VAASRLTTVRINGSPASGITGKNEPRYQQREKMGVRFIFTPGAVLSRRGLTDGPAQSKDDAETRSVPNSLIGMLMASPIPVRVLCVSLVPVPLPRPRTWRLEEITGGNYGYNAPLRKSGKVGKLLGTRS
jgi:hypothetical protein